MRLAVLKVYWLHLGLFGMWLGLLLLHLLSMKPLEQLHLCLGLCNGLCLLRLEVIVLLLLVHGLLGELGQA